MDRFTSEERSRVMASVKAENTKPEKTVRSLLHAMGYRFRLHRKDLPGKPDIVLPRYKKIIFVHGCFWHQHPNCPRAKRPSSRVEFWNKKLDRNISRDMEARQKLELQGWKVLVVWECQIRSSATLRGILDQFMLKD